MNKKGDLAYPELVGGGLENVGLSDYIASGCTFDMAMFQGNASEGSRIR